jgi:pimeloyl-ACP methyl ester carboxylesterase
MDRRMWDDQFAVFAQHYRVIRYDVRGFGKTDLPQVPYTDRQDLSNLLSFLGVEKTYVMGLSLGGEIAIDFTLDYPHMVDALILVGASVSGVPVMELITQEQLQQHIKQWTPFEEAKARRDLAGMVEGVKRVTISETHHMPNMEKPEEFNRIVLEFLAKLP